MSDWCIIIATGPSRTQKDTVALRNAGVTYAVNCAVFYAPWSHLVFGADAVWWRYYGPKIDWFKGLRVSRTYRSADVIQWRGRGWPRTGGNSGHMTIQRAVDDGFRNIALLGFDQQKTNGRAHCHADHPKMSPSGQRTNMANAGGIAAWPRLMAKTSLDLQQRGVRVVNLSRQTALTCFERMSVEEFLEDVCR